MTTFPVNSPESFGVFPSNPDYDKFGEAYPDTGDNAPDWDRDALEQGLSPKSDPRELALRSVTNARFNLANIGRDAAERFILGQTAVEPERSTEYLAAETRLVEAVELLESLTSF